MHVCKDPIRGNDSDCSIKGLWFLMSSTQQLDLYSVRELEVILNSRTW